MMQQSPRVCTHHQTDSGSCHRESLLNNTQVRERGRVRCEGENHWHRKQVSISRAPPLACSDLFPASRGRESIADQLATSNEQPRRGSGSRRSGSPAFASLLIGSHVSICYSYSAYSPLLSLSLATLYPSRNPVVPIAWLSTSSLVCPHFSEGSG